MSVGYFQDIEEARSYGASAARHKPTHAARSIVKLNAKGPSERQAAWIEGAVGVLTGNGQCLKCGRKLTDAQSLARGIGPDCVKKFGGGEAWRHYIDAITGHASSTTPIIGEAR